MRAVLAIAALAAVLATPDRAVADAADDARADALLDEGTRQFTEDADYEGARQSFQQSYEVRPGWKALNGIALTYQEQGRYLDALETYERLLAEFGDGLTDAQRATVNRRLRELEARIGRIELRVDQPEARVLVDGKPALPVTRVLPGAHVIIATLAGHEPFTRSVDVRAGESVAVEVTLAPLAERVRLVVEKRASRFERRFARWVPWSVVAGGATLLAAGGGFTWAAATDFAAFDEEVRRSAGEMPAAQQVDDSLKRDAELEQGIAVGLYVVGGAAIVTGLVLVLINQPRYVGEVVPLPGGGATVGVSGTF